MKKRAIDSTRCYLVILVIVMFQTLAKCQFEGKLCYHEDRKTNGVCKLLTDCQIAVQDFHAGKFPQDCGIQGITSILCCPEAPISEHLSVGEKTKLGQSCYHRRRKTNGVCKVLQDCHNALQDITVGKYPQNCDIEGMVVIVCCPQVATPTTTTTTTRTTAATTSASIIGPLAVGQKAKADQSCYHKRRKTNGVCKVLEDCQSALQDIKFAGKYPQDCDTEGIDVVVCCPLTNVGAKAKQACKRYEQLGYKFEHPPRLLPYPNPEKTENCPWKPHVSAVPIYSTEAIQGEFPHMVLIGYGSSDNNNYEWKCSGSLISDKFVLTAARCLFVRDLDPLVVRLGDLNYTDPNDNQYVQQIKIKKSHKHPDYLHPRFYNDIALFELEKPARLSVFVKPACLQINYSDEPAGIITGWGRTEYGIPSEHLLKATVQRFTPQICKEIYMTNRYTLLRGIDENQQICYGSKKSRDVTCLGAPGGPIQVYSDVYCSYDVIGVTSFGIRCGIVGSPGVYVKLSYYIEWIEDLVWP